MKKLVLTMVAMLTMALSVAAQDSLQTRRDRKLMNPTEMAKHRTERMVKTYGLNEEQSSRLKALNMKYAETMRPERGNHGGRPGFRPDMKGKRPQQMMNDSARVAMRKNLEAYDAELKTILTEDQYKAYNADRAKMMNRGPRRPNNK